VNHSSSKIKRILTLMINKFKKMKLVKFIVKTHLKTFGSNMILALKIMGFEDVVVFKKIILFLFDKKHEFII
jgi:hypothetical protein